MTVLQPVTDVASGGQVHSLDPAEPRFPIELEGGNVVELTANEIRRRLAIEPETFGGRVRCPVCRRMFNPSGFSPHLTSHQRAIGDLPPRKRGPNRTTRERAANTERERHLERDRERKRAEREARRAARAAAPAPVELAAVVEREALDIDDACIGLLLGITGVDVIAIEHIPAVIRWIHATSALAAIITPAR